MPWKGAENAGYQLLDEGGTEGGDPRDPAMIPDSLIVPFPSLPEKLEVSPRMCDCVYLFSFRTR